MQQTETTLFALLRSAMTGQPMTEEEKAIYSAELLPSLFLLAKKHDVAHLAAVGLEKNGLFEKGNESSQKFSKERMMAIYRYEQINYDLEEICSVFSKKNIPFIPLKGSVIRKYYPEPWMRTSCDIDILIHEEDVSKAIAALESEGYEAKGRDYHDVSLFSASGTHLELHFSLLENVENLDRVLSGAWEYASEKDGGMYAFTDAFFAFYTFAHAAYHFLTGGCGIRAVLDVWVLRHQMGVDVQKAEALLHEGEIFTFSEKLSDLAEVCFSNQPATEFSARFLKYIMDGGVYGSAKNSLAVKKEKKQSRFGYAFKRIFLPYRAMKEYYPVLRKLPFLLPFYWIVRCCRLFFGGKAKHAMKEMQAFQSVSSDSQSEAQLLCGELGLK